MSDPIVDQALPRKSIIRHEPSPGVSAERSSEPLPELLNRVHTLLEAASEADVH